MFAGPSVGGSGNITVGVGVDEMVELATAVLVAMMLLLAVMILLVPMVMLLVLLVPMVRLLVLLGPVVMTDELPILLVEEILLIVLLILVEELATKVVVGVLTNNAITISSDGVPSPFSFSAVITRL
jgi:hypothetical protein